MLVNFLTFVNFGVRIFFNFPSCVNMGIRVLAARATARRRSRALCSASTTSKCSYTTLLAIRRRNAQHVSASAVRGLAPHRCLEAVTDTGGGTPYAFSRSSAEGLRYFSSSVSLGVRVLAARGTSTIACLVQRFYVVQVLSVSCPLS